MSLSVLIANFHLLSHSIIKVNPMMYVNFSCKHFEMMCHLYFNEQIASLSASQMLGILRKSWQVIHDRLLLGKCFLDFVLPILEYCSALWCSAADTHLKLLDHVVRCVSFLTTGEIECDLAHRRSVAVLCMLYKIRCNPRHPLYGALPLPYVPVRVTRGAVIARGYTYEPPRCRTSQYLITFIPLSVSVWNDLGDPIFDGVGLECFRSRANVSLFS